ncbi:pyridoxamine 5'-phosphate oxidase family protein [Streptomyces albidoflavus]
MAPPDVHDFLARPLVARVATAGPTVRPVWFLWEDGAFWWLTGAYARLGRRLAGDPVVALVVDSCDLATGQVLSVTCRGTAEVVPLDRARAVRKLTRYLGPEEDLAGAVPGLTGRPGGPAGAVRAGTPAGGA